MLAGRVRAWARNEDEMPRQGHTEVQIALPLHRQRVGRFCGPPGLHRVAMAFDD